MTDIFRDRSCLERPGTQTEYDLGVMRTKLDDNDRFWTDRPLPGARKYPLDVANLVRPRRGHDY